MRIVLSGSIVTLMVWQTIVTTLMTAFLTVALLRVIPERVVCEECWEEVGVPLEEKQ